MAGRRSWWRSPEPPAALEFRRADLQVPIAPSCPLVVVREIGARRARRLRRQGRTPVQAFEAASYGAWILRCETPTPSQAADMESRARALSGPRFRISVPDTASVAERQALSDSLYGQLYPNWTFSETADFVVAVEPGAVLAPFALLLLAEAIRADPQADLLYADQDVLTGGKRHSPWFKPDFSPERQRRQDLFGALGVMRAHLAGSVPPDWTRLAQGVRVRHVPHVLAHAGRKPPAPATARGPIAKDDRRWPSVTAIVPTRDHAAVLRPCLEGLWHGTDYPALGILVADNDSAEPDALALLAEAERRGASVLRCSGPFNYAAINNRAAQVARGELLLFLNNDIAMIERDWLMHMVLLAQGPDVGAVGAKLLYPDGTLQHGGVVLGLSGVAGHVHVGAPGRDPGHGYRLHVPQEVSAVTAACMIVPARDFAAVGGFDADNLAVAFNDVDLCLRLRKAGRRILWTPDAVLYHAKSKTRGSDLSPEHLPRFRREIDYMQSRWGAELTRDAFYSPNLSLETAEATLAFPPRVRPTSWE